MDWIPINNRPLESILVHRMVFFEYATRSSFHAISHVHCVLVCSLFDDTMAHRSYCGRCWNKELRRRFVHSGHCCPCKLDDGCPNLSKDIPLLLLSQLKVPYRFRCYGDAWMIFGRLGDTVVSPRRKVWCVNGFQYPRLLSFYSILYEQKKTSCL